MKNLIQLQAIMGKFFFHIFCDFSSWYDKILYFHFDLTPQNYECFFFDYFPIFLSSLVAGQIMGCDVIYTRPIEEVGIIYDILMSAKHSNFPVVDTDDKDVLYGTIGRNQMCVLLQNRAFGHPIDDSHFGASRPNSVRSNFLQVGEKKYFPLVQWETLFKSYPRYPDATDLRITEEDRKCLLDLRPYINSAAISIQETSSVEVRT